jgi:hypothetical protein
MSRVRLVRLSILMLLTLGALLAGSAPAAASLVLKLGGQVAPVGTRALGVLRFGPCGTFESRGTLTVNSSRVDRARFSSTEGGGGGCGEGGPIISGSVSANKLTEAGRFVVVASLTYTTTVSGICEYTVKRLHGTFTIPGPTQASVSGMGKRTAGSSSSCPEKTRVAGAEAKLYGLETNELFEAEL